MSPLEAGPELDRLVDERAMGRSDGRMDGGVYQRPTGLLWCPWERWQPSTYIGHAWEVIEHLAAAYGIALSVGPELDKLGESITGYCCHVSGSHLSERLGAERGIGYPSHEDGYEMIAKTAPLAVCLGALTAVSNEPVIQ